LFPKGEFRLRTGLRAHLSVFAFSNSVRDENVRSISFRIERESRRGHLSELPPPPEVGKESK